MAEPNPEEHVWGEISKRVARLFGLTTGRSATLTETIKRGVRFVYIDGEEILFHSRALLFGMLLAGMPDPSGIPFANAALWLRKWLAEQVGERDLAAALAAVPDRSEE